jgi:hypothetical protein
MTHDTCPKPTTRFAWEFTPDDFDPVRVYIILSERTNDGHARFSVSNENEAAEEQWRRPILYDSNHEYSITQIKLMTY